MKKITFLVIIASMLVFTSVAQNKDSLRVAKFTSSSVGKFIFKIDKTKTKIVYSLVEANKLLNASGTKDILLSLTDEKDETTCIHFFKLSDGRLVRIENVVGIIRFYFSVDYWDPAKKNGQKLVECWVTENGNITELATLYGIDPKGKNGFVTSAEVIKSTEELKKSGVSFSMQVNGNNPISEKDPVVIRYQKEINDLLKVLK